MNPSDWQPASTAALLAARAQLLASLRAFFEHRGVMEVDVPLLGSHTVTDIHLQPFHLRSGSLSGWLQTSPEYYMKRLLAAGLGDIYYLGKAFRQDESGRHHNPEFSMLEWYRLGWDDRRLADEVVELIQAVAGERPLTRCSYRELFLRHVGLDPLSADIASLSGFAQSRLDLGFDSDDRDVWLNLIMSQIVEPAMPEGICVVFDFPASQAALARTQEVDGQQVARRFEVYVDGVEQANGYWELVDAQEQRRRFEKEAEHWASQGQERAPDPLFLAALEQGLPDCAGVALGVDRLVMLATGCDHLNQVLAFPWSRA